MWIKRAKRRLDLFESYKSLGLLKIMKTILKDFKIIKQNTRHLDSQYQLHQRVLFFKEFEIKQALIAATEAAVERGVFGAPTFFIDGVMHFGQDRMDWVEAEAAGN